MIKRSEHFEPQRQMTVAIDELQQAMTDARAAIDRVNWRKARLLDEYKKIR